jgi:ABC-type branched-subunit amino acid transport system ATPase component
MDGVCSQCRRRADSLGPHADCTSDGAAAAPICPAGRSRCWRSRALVREPKIVLLDEPFEGLAPIIVRDLLATCRSLAEQGQTIVVVEQNITAAMSLADRMYIINNGHIVEAMTAQAVRDRPEVLHRHLGV